MYVNGTQLCFFLSSRILNKKSENRTMIFSKIHQPHILGEHLIDWLSCTIGLIDL